MMRHLLLAGLLLAGGAVFAKTQGTFAQMTDVEEAAGAIEAEVVVDGQHDPWHPYEDVNNDNKFTNGIDVPLTDAEVLDGQYTASHPNHGLVIPRSVGPIDVDGPLHLEAGNNGHLVVEVRLAATGGITLIAGTDARLGNLAATGTTGITLEASGGTLELEGAILTAPQGPVELSGRNRLSGLEMNLEAGQAVTLSSSQGPVHVTAASITAGLDLTVTSKAEIRADDASLVAGTGMTLDAGDDVFVKRASLEAVTDIVLDGKNRNSNLFVEGARFADANDTAKASPGGITIVGTPAEGAITYAG